MRGRRDKEARMLKEVSCHTAARLVVAVLGLRLYVSFIIGKPNKSLLLEHL